MVKVATSFQLERRMTRRDDLVLGALVISWVGVVVHNLADLPQLPPWDPGYVIPTIVSILLFLAWRQGTQKRLAAVLLLTWGVSMLVAGAIVTVLPLGILPFDPAQTLTHYFFHGLYAAAQLPLIAISIREARRRRPLRRPASEHGSGSATRDA